MDRTGMDGRVATFGEIMLRLAAPGCERFLQQPVFEATFGGGEANVAVALASLGMPAAYITVLPENNPIAEAAIGELRRFDVDTAHVVRRKGRMGIYYLEKGANQRPPRVVYDREHSAMARAQPGDICWEAAFAGAAWFHITGITPAISEAAAKLSFEAVRAARAAGLTVSCDLNYRKNLWKWGKQAREVMPELAALCDVLIGNEEDLQMALGLETAADVSSGTLDPRHYETLANAALASHPTLRLLAITLRESKSASHNGWSACLNDRTGFFVSRHYEITDIVDRVGAGDSFAAGLIYGLLRLPTIRQALEFATALGCLKHSVAGDFSRTTREEVEALLRGEGSGRVQR
jgi:2-dehydro-3-deoxygluconokinase